MAKNNKTSSEVLSYRHTERRKNNPEVGMVSPDTDPDGPKTTYSYDPHIDPTLQFDSARSAIEKLIDDALSSGDEANMRLALEQLKRQQDSYLNWTGKAESTNFEVDTVSLHVHERIDPASILSAVRTQIKKSKEKTAPPSNQLGLFSAPFENLPLRDAIDFYKHDRGWSNRLIAGDSLLVMNSLIQKEAMAGQVQMIFIDPPYGIKYGSNFQPFVNKKDVKDRKDEDLTQEPETIKAFRDTWELGIHSYLSYLRDRLILSKELLHTTGSIFIQISDENLHHVRELLDEVFGSENFIGFIPFRTKNMPFGGKFIEGMCDYLLWYGKQKSETKYNPLFQDQDVQGASRWNWVLLPDGQIRSMTGAEFKNHSLLPKGSDPVRHSSLKPSGYSETAVFNVNHHGVTYSPPKGTCWKTTEDGMRRLSRANRIGVENTNLCFRLRFSDYQVERLNNMWTDTSGASDKIYSVQTMEKVLERCILMTTDPGDLVFDPTCGSGTTAFVAEKYGRRWITCDTSRVAIVLAKQRLMTGSFDYYELRYPGEGLRGGFIYQTVPHITLGDIANNPEIDEIWERFSPQIEVLLKKLSTELNVQFNEWDLPEDKDPSWSSTVAKLYEDVAHLIKSRQIQIDSAIFNSAGKEQLFDKPAIDKKKARISGPFTVEAVPSPMVKSLDETPSFTDIDSTVARLGESQRHHEWKDELVKTGIRGKNGQLLKLSDIETLPDVRHLHASGNITDTGERVVVSFGPEYAQLEQRQVEMALREAGELFPRPKMILFCGFDFDSEAAKDIDSTKGIIALKVKMNADLLTNDLKKQRTSNQSFWLMGQPDVEIKKNKAGQWVVEVHGFDYFDTAKGELISGGKSNIAAWMLDTDYDSRSLFPRQVFFPMSGAKDGWNKLKKNIKAELDESALEKFSGTISLPFETGESKRIAVKIIDDRGIESLKVIDLTD